MRAVVTPSTDRDGFVELDGAIHVLALDDDESVLLALRRVLSTRGFSTETLTDPQKLFAALRDRAADFDLVTLDVEMPRMNGLRVLEQAREIVPDMPFVMVTGDDRAETAVKALKSGAFSYVTKSRLRDADTIAAVLRKAAAYGRLHRKAMLLERQVANARQFERLVGASRPMRALFSSIERVSALEVNVLLLGESGTGKELVAQAVHDRSPRADKPFVALNCAALPDTLVDSELFGHTRGAFTGAVESREGAFQRANGGTLFLDEIGDISPAVQTRLLRVLQEGEVRRLGRDSVDSVDVRVIAATHVDLTAAVESKVFREDLYYRLNVVSLAMPRLRERVEDIPLLAAHLLEKHAARFGRDVPRISPEAMDALCAHSWPGNVRELENAMQRALAMSPSDTIEMASLPEVTRLNGTAVAAPTELTVDAMDWTDSLSMSDAKKESARRFERAYLRRLLTATGGNISEAARRAGVDRANLRRVLQRCGVNAADFVG